MNIFKTDILIDIVVKSKSDLQTLTNKLIDNNIIHFIITEEKVAIGSTDTSFNVITKSTLTNAYIVTIHSKDVDILIVLNDLNLISKV